VERRKTRTLSLPTNPQSSILARPASRREAVERGSEVGDSVLVRAAWSTCRIWQPRSTTMTRFEFIRTHTGELRIERHLSGVYAWQTKSTLRVSKGLYFRKWRPAAHFRHRPRTLATPLATPRRFLQCVKNIWSPDHPELVQFRKRDWR
jgi:hypothetical protein